MSIFPDMPMLNFHPSLDMPIFNVQPSSGQTLDKMVFRDKEKVEKKPTTEAGSGAISCDTILQHTKFDLSSDHSMCSDNSFTGMDKTTTQSTCYLSGETRRRKNRPRLAVHGMILGPSFLFTKSKKSDSSFHVAKSRTWHRTSNPTACPHQASKLVSNVVPPEKQLLAITGKVQNTAYIRKGNSLVRKPSSAGTSAQDSHIPSYPLSQLSNCSMAEVSKSIEADGRVDVNDLPSSLDTGLMNSVPDRTHGPILQHCYRIANPAVISSGDCTSSSLSGPLSYFPGTTPDPIRSIDDKGFSNLSHDALKSSGNSGNQNDPMKNPESQSFIGDGNLASSTSKSLRHKLNQLGAATNTGLMPVLDAENNEGQSTDGYYKRNKNQLVRAPYNSEITQKAVSGDGLNSKGQRSSKVISSKTSHKRKSDEVACKQSKFSFTWTPHGRHISRRGSVCCYSILPQLFPWKRAKCWRSFTQNSTRGPGWSFPGVRKLLLLRKHDAIYTRSTNGFSLRKSKVLSVSGSNLKWSKSIERHSKIANEEATLAVAAANRKRREQNGAARAISVAETEIGERIFHIGSVRYKMDPSKCTLRRISGDESSSHINFQEKDAKKCYVRRRLAVANNKYSRMGNGNKLIRDPKKRARDLASEKVRWSLHTARQRLARKRKYCQFFTRFGKCNKGDGKCTYIHDPSKVAVCTKFLNGLCSNSNCKLTHKVIPERMPDCSYFLQGLCSNKNCPYRHVNVNPNASTCEGFLRGYCADGNECRKKHSYACPVFETTGACPQGSNCKLHHSRKRGKGKRKKTETKRNTRYFGAKCTEGGELGDMASLKHSRQNNSGGLFGDYISIDDSDDDIGDCPNPAPCLDDYANTLSDDSDELTRPIRLMTS